MSLWISQQQDFKEAEVLSHKREGQSCTLMWKVKDVTKRATANPSQSVTPLWPSLEGYDFLLAAQNLFWYTFNYLLLQLPLQTNPLLQLKPPPLFLLLKSLFLNRISFKTGQLILTGLLIYRGPSIFTNNCLNLFYSYSTPSLEISGFSKSHSWEVGG